MEIPLYELLQNHGLIRGSVVQSLAGHDQMKAYLVIKVEGCFVWLVDGDLRRYEKPKKKRIRHVRPLGQIPDPEALDRIGALGDEGQRNSELGKLLQIFIGTNLMKEEN